MLLKNEILEEIKAGNIRYVFRRWKRPTVKTGGTLRTRQGLLSIKEVRSADEAKLTRKEARAAGFETVEELREMLSGREGAVYRIEVEYAGEDPRITLRNNKRVTKDELSEIKALFERWNKSKVFGEWPLKYLTMIAENPGTHAQILADSVNLPKNKFKGQIRKLKELGLTISLSPGYKLSPRGEVVLKSLSE